MKKSRNLELTRTKILDATHKLLRQGDYLTRFSLDAVAREAGVSKGGLMHHFPSKDALLEAAAQDAIGKFEATMDKETVADAGDFTKAYVAVGMGREALQPAEYSPVLLGYLRNAGNSPQSRFDYWQQKSDNDGIDVDLATIVRLAVDGLIYTEMIDNERINGPRRQRIQQRLLDLVALAETA